MHQTNGQLWKLRTVLYWSAMASSSMIHSKTIIQLTCPQTVAECRTFLQNICLYILLSLSTWHSFPERTKISFHFYRIGVKVPWRWKREMPEGNDKGKSGITLDLRGMSKYQRIGLVSLSVRNCTSPIARRTLFFTVSSTTAAASKRPPT